MEAAGGDQKKNGAHGVEGQAIEPEMRKTDVRASGQFSRIRGAALKDKINRAEVVGEFHVNQAFPRKRTSGEPWGTCPVSAFYQALSPLSGGKSPSQHPFQTGVKRSDRIGNEKSASVVMTTGIGRINLRTNRVRRGRERDRRGGGILPSARSSEVVDLAEAQELGTGSLTLHQSTRVRKTL